jgi:hypothetical protein
MKITKAIAAAILVFTASAMPIAEQNSITPETTSTGLPFDSHPDNLESLPTITNGLSTEDQNDYRGLGPIPLSVAPNGIIAPGSVEPPMSSDSDFPNKLKDSPIITRGETHVKGEIDPTRPGFRPARMFGGHGPIIQPPHARDAAQIEPRNNSTDQPFRDMYEIYGEEHLNEILDTVCPVGKYLNFGPRLSSACNSWTPPSNISAVGGFNSTSNITTTNQLGHRSMEASSDTNDTHSIPSLGSNHKVALFKVASIFDQLEIVFHQSANKTAKHQALLDATAKFNALSDTVPEFAVLFGGRLRDVTLHSKYVRPSNTTTNSTATSTKLASQNISPIIDRVRSNPNHHRTTEVSFPKFKNSTLHGNNRTAQDQKAEVCKCNIRRKKKHCFCNTPSHGSHTTKSPNLP